MERNQFGYTDTKTEIKRHFTCSCIVLTTNNSVCNNHNKFAITNLSRRQKMGAQVSNVFQRLHARNDYKQFHCSYSGTLFYKPNVLLNHYVFSQ